MAQLARQLAATGLEPVFVVKEPAKARAILGSVPWEIWPAPPIPIHPLLRSNKFLAASYADILAVRGFGSVETLLQLVRGWDNLIQRVQPALVVCDHSPGLVLAAYRRLPTVLLGIAFAMPPVHQPTFPRLLRGRELLQPEEEMLRIVQEVQRIEGRAAPATLPALFDSAARFVTALPELDPYQPWRRDMLNRTA